MLGNIDQSLQQHSDCNFKHTEVHISKNLIKTETN